MLRAEQTLRGGVREFFSFNCVSLCFPGAAAPLLLPATVYCGRGQEGSSGGGGYGNVNRGHVSYTWKRGPYIASLSRRSGEGRKIPAQAVECFTPRESVAHPYVAGQLLLFLSAKS